MATTQSNTISRKRLWTHHSQGTLPMGLSRLLRRSSSRQNRRKTWTILQFQRWRFKTGPTGQLLLHRCAGQSGTFSLNFAPKGAWLQEVQLLVKIIQSDHVWKWKTDRSYRRQSFSQRLCKTCWKRYFSNGLVKGLCTSLRQFLSD